MMTTWGGGVQVQGRPELPAAVSDEDPSSVTIHEEADI